MSIDKDLLDLLMEGRSPGALFGKAGILAELTKALAEPALNTEMASISMKSGQKKRLRARPSLSTAAMGAAGRR